MRARAAVRPAKRGQKLFRVAVMTPNVVPHSRKLDAVGPHRSRRKSHGRRAHRRRAHRTARAARHAWSRRTRSSPSCPTRRARRRSRRRAPLVNQRETELEAKRQPDRDRHHAEARSRESRIAIEGRRGRAGRRAKPSATAASCARRGPASSPKCRSRSGRRRSRWPAARSRRSLRSIRCWRSSKSPSASWPASRSATRPKSGSSPARPRPARCALSRSRRAASTRTYRVEVEITEPDGRDSGRHHRRSRDPAGARQAAQRAALGADVLVRRRSRRAHRRCGRAWSRSLPVNVIEDEQSQMWVDRRSPTARA